MKKLLFSLVEPRTWTLRWVLFRTWLCLIPSLSLFLWLLNTNVAFESSMAGSTILFAYVMVVFMVLIPLVLGIILAPMLNVLIALFFLILPGPSKEVAE